MNYLSVTEDVYRKAAEKPDVGLCCTTSPVWQLPGLKVPSRMLEMNYGCGTTVHPRDLADSPRVLYVGVGGGMEVLQFAYFTRKKGSIVGVDIVDEMIEACRVNLLEAEKDNDWFDADFVELKKGTALDLPLPDASVDVAAQNCLFNIFEPRELKRALHEIYRVLKPHGRLVLSDPVCDQEIPRHLREDNTLRALCISGSLPLADYLNMITEIGFGTIEVRARRPYRVLTSNHYDVDASIYIESVEIAAIKDPLPPDGPCIFTGKAAIYTGDEDQYDDRQGHILIQGQPVAVCDKTAAALASLGNSDIYITESTWFYDGGGCC